MIHDHQHEDMEIITKNHHFFACREQFLIDPWHRFLFHSKEEIFVIDILELSVRTESQIFVIHCAGHPQRGDFLPWVSPLDQTGPVPRNNL